MFLFFIGLLKCDAVTNHYDTVVSDHYNMSTLEDQEGYLVPRLLDQKISNENTDEKINSREEKNDLYLEVLPEDEPIYETIPESSGIYENIDSILNNTNESVKRNDLEHQISQRGNINIGDILYKGIPASKIFSDLVHKIKTEVQELNFRCLDSVRLTDAQFEQMFNIKFISSTLFSPVSKNHLFFIEFKRLLIEVILFVGDQNFKVRRRFNNKPREIFDGLFASLIQIYFIIFNDNNLFEILNKNKSNAVKERLDEIWALELLQSVFYPKQFIERFDESIKWLANGIAKNTKKYKILGKGFGATDMISVNIRGKTRIYPARYYVIGSILHSIIK